MRPHKGKKSVGRTQTVRRGNCGWSSLGMVRQTCPDPCLVLKTRVCLRHGVDLFGRNVRKQLKCVFLSVCRAPSRLVETVVSNSLIFLTSHHLLWQTRFLFRIVLGLFISGPVSSPLTTSLSSALVCFFLSPPNIRIKCHTTWAPIPAGLFSQIFFVQVSFLCNLLTVSQRLSLFSNSAAARLPNGSHFPHRCRRCQCDGYLNFCHQDMEQVVLLSWRTDVACRWALLCTDTNYVTCARIKHFLLKDYCGLQIRILKFSRSV